MKWKCVLPLLWRMCTPILKKLILQCNFFFNVGGPCIKGTRLKDEPLATIVALPPTQIMSHVDSPGPNLRKFDKTSASLSSLSLFYSNSLRLYLKLIGEVWSFQWRHPPPSTPWPPPLDPLPLSDSNPSFPLLKVYTSAHGPRWAGGGG